MTTRCHRNGLFCLIALLSLLCMALPRTALADSTYTYTGNTFTYQYGTLSCPPGCSVTGSFTVATPLLADAAYFFTPESFSFSAMGVTFTQSTVSSDAFGVITDASGNIIGWNMNWYEGNYEMFSGTGPSVICPSGCSQVDVIAQVSGSTDIGGGGISNSPGTWSVTTAAVPEPSTILLLGLGMLMAVGLTVKKGVLRI